MNKPIEPIAMPSKTVYQAINSVQADLVKIGISKDSKNTFDGYNFRGIDAVYNALSPLLAKHGLCILPRMLSRQCEERQSQKGGALFYVTIEAEFDFVSSADGSKHTVKTYGEAMDRGDKATNKAMSAAYKYAAFQAFAIPTEGDNDADSASHEVESGEWKKFHDEAKKASSGGTKSLGTWLKPYSENQDFRNFWTEYGDHYKTAAKNANEELAGAM